MKSLEVFSLEHIKGVGTSYSEERIAKGGLLCNEAPNLGSVGNRDDADRERLARVGHA